MLSVELDSILSYDVSFPFEQSEHSFRETSAEEGVMGGILMLTKEGLTVAARMAQSCAGKTGRADRSPALEKKEQSPS